MSDTIMLKLQFLHTQAEFDNYDWWEEDEEGGEGGEEGGPSGADDKHSKKSKDAGHPRSRPPTRPPTREDLIERLQPPHATTHTHSSGRTHGLAFQ